MISKFGYVFPDVEEGQVINSEETLCVFSHYDEFTAGQKAVINQMIFASVGSRAADKCVK